MGSFSIVNNIAGLTAQNNLSLTNLNLQKTLFRLSSGLRINTGADDAAGLGIADGLRGNIAALQQSVRNVNDGVGYLQTADGAYGQVTSLLNRAITIATEAATGTVSSGQRDTLNTEFNNILSEIDRIGSRTQFNATTIFNRTVTVFTSDSTATGSSSVAVTLGSLSVAALSLNLVALSGSDGAIATTALNSINAAISTIATQRGTVGATLNRLQAASNVFSNQIQNLTAAESGIRDANPAEEVLNLTKFTILSQTGVAALAQANARAQTVLSLLR